MGQSKAPGRLPQPVPEEVTRTVEESRALCDYWFDEKHGTTELLGAGNDLSPYLERMIADARSRGLRVIVFAQPLHPHLFNELSPEYSEFVSSQENKFRGWCQKDGAEFVGSYDPRVGGWSESDFYDGWHLRPAAVERFISMNKVGQ